MNPIEIHWEVTNRCNLRCKHCLPASGLPRQHELTSDEIRLAIGLLASVGVKHLY